MNMTHIDLAHRRSEGAKQWRLVIKNCFMKRLQGHQISSAFKTLDARYHTRPQEIVGIILSFRAGKGVLDDALLFQYLRVLLDEKLASTSDILLALLKDSHFKSADTANAQVNSLRGLASCEERILLLLARRHLRTDLPTCSLAVQNLVHAVYLWLKTVSEFEMSKQLEGSGIPTVDPPTFGLYEALASLALSILSNQSIRALTQKRWWKSKRALVVSEMINYDTHILQWINSQLAGRLRALTSLPPYIELDSRGAPIFTDQQILDSIPEIAAVHSRAGLFVWLNAALTARPVADDITILSYLHARNPGDAQNSVEELLVASFDVFTSALLRKESLQSQKIVRSFICNKVPLLISMLSGNITPPMTAESCIQMALSEPPAGHISMNPLQPITAGAGEVRENLKTLRLDFLQACALHGHITESSLGTIIGESIALPRVTKYNKESLVAQCSNNISKFEGLVADLDGMQGNTGAIAGCIVDTITNLCIGKDSMALKSVCNELLKSVSSMDFVMLFTHPSTLLSPLCTLLNNWIHDQEQTEFTPSYEEFASILLFSLALIHRYDLKMSEIGLMPDRSESFISKLLSQMSISRPTAELSADQNSQLAKWIESLYAVDEHGESSGIGDDVMRNCSPQEFYGLVSTLFEQSVLACRSNALTMKTFRIGLELLLEQFLLPSLVMGLRWMAEHSWEDHHDAEILLQVLDKLLKPSSSSQEMKAMHHAVVSMVATPVYESLQGLLQKQPDKKKAVELSGVLRRYIGGQRSVRASKGELDDWIRSDGSLEGRLQRNIRELVTWEPTTATPPNPPPKYSYREFAITCQVLEADVVLRAVVAELMETSNLPVALDICSAMICTPTTAPVTPQQSAPCIGPTSKLRDNVRLVGSNIQGLLDKKRGEAEVLVQLGRRVAAQLAVVQLPPIQMPIQIQDQTADQIMQDLGMGLTGTGDGTNVDGSINEPTDLPDLSQQLDMSNASNQEMANLAASTAPMDLEQSNIFGDINLGLNSGDNQQTDLQDQEEDIFAGLDNMDIDMGDMGMGDDDFFS